MQVEAPLLCSHNNVLRYVHPLYSFKVRCLSCHFWPERLASINSAVKHPVKEKETLRILFFYLKVVLLISGLNGQIMH